jgi:hypothetical protein
MLGEGRQWRECYGRALRRWWLKERFDERSSPWLQAQSVHGSRKDTDRYIRPCRSDPSSDSRTGGSVISPALSIMPGG